MERIAVFPGSFDPFTIGHESIVRRSIGLFDKIVIAIGVNSEKKGFFPLEQRLEWISKIFAKDSSVQVTSFQNLTVDFCKSISAKFILRGLRNSNDFEYERTIGLVNSAMDSEIETIFLLTAPEHTGITSSIVREIIKFGGNPGKFLPKEIII